MIHNGPNGKRIEWLFIIFIIYGMRFQSFFLDDGDTTGAVLLEFF